MNPNTYQLNSNPSLFPITNSLVSEYKPTVNIAELQRKENDQMFQFLPVLREQSQYKDNNVGYMPNAEKNQILNQEKMNNTINRKNGTQVLPSQSFNLNFFPAYQ